MKLRTLVLPGERSIGDGLKPYVVAEINTSHFGDRQFAVDSIHAAKAAGVDAVKFQSWAPESLFTDSYLSTNSLEARIYRKLSLDLSDLKYLADVCVDIELGFASTPYSTDEIKDLVRLPNVPFVKIASMDLPNRELLAEAAYSGLPVFLSTGMSTDDEINDAIDFLQSRTAKILVFHCTSVYPTPRTSVNLNNILSLRNRFPTVPIGFSDHTLGFGAAVAAVPLGASVFEKHFTLDQSRIGFDNSMASEPDELTAYVREINETYLSLGSFERTLNDEELSQRSLMRRSIFASRDISPGEIISRDMLQFKRPGNGLGLDRLEEIIGRTASKAIMRDAYISNEDIQ